MSLEFLLRHLDGRAEFGVNNMKVWIHPALNQQFSLTVWAIFSSYTLGYLVQFEHHLNVRAFLNIVADNVHHCLTIVYPSSHSYFQKDNVPCHKAWFISTWLLEHDTEFNVLKWPLSPHLSSIDRLCVEVGDMYHAFAAGKSAETAVLPPHELFVRNSENSWYAST